MTVVMTTPCRSRRAGISQELRLHVDLNTQGASLATNSQQVSKEGVASSKKQLCVYGKQLALY